MKYAVPILISLLFALGLSLSVGTQSTANNTEFILNTPVAIHKPSSTDEELARWNMMVGKWYGNQPTKYGGRREWLMERKKTGEYIIEFKVTDKDGKIDRQIERGEWGIDGPIYFNIFKAYMENGQFYRADPSTPYNSDAYKITSLTNEEMVFHHYTTETKYLIKKVADDFKLQ